MNTEYLLKGEVEAPIQAEGVLVVVGEVEKCQTVTFQDPENQKKYKILNPISLNG